jgi:cell division protein FtsI/penicillin-binding protein 2
MSETTAAAKAAPKPTAGAPVARGAHDEPNARARSISRWACVLVAGVAFGIAGITARVVQLKLDPGEQLLASMADANGKLAQQRAVSDALPRGEILDRNGRTLALDTMSGTLYIDVRDLYRDTLDQNKRSAARIAAGKARESDRIVLDPISELAAQLGPMLGIPSDEVVARVVHLDPIAGDHERVPLSLRRIPASGELTDAEWAALPRYVVVEKDMEEEQIALLRKAKEAGGPTSIVRAAHMQPKSERERPYEDIGAPIVGRTGIDAISPMPLVVDVRDLFREAHGFNAEAIKRLAQDEDLRLIDDPVGDVAESLAPIAGMTRDQIVAAILGADAVLPEARLKAWALARQTPAEELEAWLETLPTAAVIKAGTTDKEREALKKAKQAEKAKQAGGAAPALAYVSVRPGLEGVVGRSGVERIANARLQSQPGYTTYFASRLGSVISIPPDGYRQGDKGDEVRLSIDIVIQEMVENRVNDMVARSNASGGRALVLDASSGEILAAYSTINTKTGREPITTDWGQSDPALARMRWATDPFEPGSIFKAFVWAWATDHGFARRNETIRLPDGPMVLTDGRAKRSIREAHDSSYGTKTWEQVLVKSVNAGMATVAWRMGNDEMKQCLSDWQFGELCLSNDNDKQPEAPKNNFVESKGLKPREEEWSNKTRALTVVSFGQGIAVTPLQLVRAFSAFCRDGDMVPLSLQPIARGSLTGSMPVLSSSTVRESKEVMELVITEGTGKKLKNTLQYRAFGKSGTAQLASPTGGYYKDKWLASFIAGAPFDRPEIVVLVTIEDPDKEAKDETGKPVGTGGGNVAGPVVAEIINDVLGYMGIPSEGELVYPEKADADKKKLATR